MTPHPLIMNTPLAYNGSSLRAVTIGGGAGWDSIIGGRGVEGKLGHLRNVSVVRGRKDLFVQPDLGVGV